MESYTTPGDQEQKMRQMVPKLGRPFMIYKVLEGNAFWLSSLDGQTLHKIQEGILPSSIEEDEATERALVVGVKRPLGR